MMFAEHEHAENPPSTWQVVKVDKRRWDVATRDGVVLTSATTRAAAVDLTRSGPFVTLYRDEGRWYAGETVRGWKPYVRPAD